MDTVDQIVDYLLEHGDEWGMEMGERVYEVVEHDGYQWVRRIGHEQPILFIQGVDEDSVSLANKVAGMMGVKESYEKNKRWGRSQAQMELIKGMAGVEVWVPNVY